MMDVRRRLARFCGAMTVMALTLGSAACNHGSGHNGLIGNGNGPASLVVRSPQSLPGAASFDMFDCFRAQVQAILIFQDGSSGDFTSRVVWSSSSPGTVTVSNGDQAVPGTTPTQFYAHGAVTPVSDGNATITANYFGLLASINVTVSAPQSLTVQRVVNSNLLPITALSPAPPPQEQPTTQPIPTTGFNMGIGTTEDLTVTAVLNGQEQNIEATGVNWSFLQPNDGEASIDPNTGVITGINVGGPLVAMVTFDSCPYLASTQVTVSNIRAITLVPEFSGNPTLIVGNTELISVMADFGSGPEQDVSKESTLVSADSTVIGFGLAGASNIASAEAAGGPEIITATFAAGGTRLIASNLQLTTELAVFESISVTPLEATVSIGSIAPAQFRAFGSYNGGAIIQEVTRQVTWTVSDTTIAKIATGVTNALTAGQALAIGSNIGTVQVTATDAAATVFPTVNVSLVVTF